MNATATPPLNVAALDFDSIVTFPREQVRRGLPRVGSDKKVEEELSALIIGGSPALLKFCRDLSANLVRNYLVEDDASELHEKLCSSLVSTLACSRQEAQCLLDLALEMIHVKVHREYRRSNVDLGYLIAMGHKAVNRKGQRL